MKKILFLFFLIVSYSHCATQNNNYSLGCSNVSPQYNNAFSIRQLLIKLYNNWFKNKSFSNNISTDPRNQTEENSLTRSLNIHENKQYFMNYLNYFCSNLTIITFNKNTKQNETAETKEGSKLTRNLSLYIHPDKFNNENKDLEKILKTKAEKLFQIISNKETLALIPSEGKTFFIRSFFELLNRHSDIAKFEEDLNCIHDIAKENQFSLNEFSQLTIDEIIQQKNRLDELYKKSWKYKINQTIDSIIQIGVIQSFCSRFGEKLARNFIPHLKQAKNNQHYDEACKHYNVDTIKNPNQKEYIIDQLKIEYNQYSHRNFLNKAIKTAMPYLNSPQINKVFKFF